MIDPHRGARPPRLWPQLWIVPAAYAATWALSGLGWPGIALAAVVGVTLGYGSVQIRWVIWRKRHPLRPCGPDCILAGSFGRFAARQREVAPWQ